MGEAPEKARLATQALVVCVYLCVSVCVCSCVCVSDELMSSPCSKRAWSKTKSDLARFSSFARVCPLVDMPLFGGFPLHRLALSTRNWIGSGKGLMLPSRFCLMGMIFSVFGFFFFSFFFFFLFFFSSVRTAFNGYRKKHTGTGSSSQKRACCSLV